MVSYQKEMLNSSWTDWTFKLKLLPCPLSGLLQAGRLQWGKVGVCVQLLCFSVLYSYICSLASSGSIGLPLSLSGLGDGKPVKKRFFFFQSQFWLVHRFPPGNTQLSFLDVSKVSPSFWKQLPARESHWRVLLQDINYATERLHVSRFWRLLWGNLIDSSISF